METQPRYLAFLLRLWQVRYDEEDPRKGEESGRTDGVTWRASLESARSGERKAFASLDELFACLRRQTGLIVDVDSSDASRDVRHCQPRWQEPQG